MSDSEGDDHGEEQDQSSLPLAARLELLSRGSTRGEQSGFTGRKRRRDATPTIGASAAGGDDSDQDDAGRAAEATKVKKKRKGAPKELPSNRQVSRLRTVIEPVKKGKGRDPRFDEACGKVNYQMFRKAYGFLDEYQEREIDVLKKSMKREKSRERLEELTTSLRKAQQERGERRKKDRLLTVKQTTKQEERRKVADGKQPFFLKKREVKKRELEQRYDELSKSGRLEDKLAKKRKKNFGKALRWVPKDRKVAGEE